MSWAGSLSLLLTKQRQGFQVAETGNLASDEKRSKRGLVEL